MFHERSVGLDHVHIRLLEQHFLAGALATRLLAGLLRPADDDAFAERVKTMHQNAAEAVAVSDQQRHSCDAPNDAQHGEEAASEVSLQRDPGFENDLNQHATEVRYLRRSAIRRPHNAALRSGLSMRLAAPDTAPPQLQSLPAIPPLSIPSSSSATGQQKNRAWAAC